MSRRGKWFAVFAPPYKTLKTAHKGRLHSSLYCLLYCFLFGAVYSLPYTWEWAFFLTYPALIFFFLLLRSDGLRKKTYRACFCFLLGFLLPLYRWFFALRSSLRSFGFSGAAALGIALLGCFAVPLIQAAVQAAILQCIRFLPQENGVLHALGISSLWVLSEKLLSFGTLALPWGTVALSQSGFSPLLQAASLFGQSGIAFAVVFVCDLFASGIRKKRKRERIGSIAVLSALCLLGVFLPVLPFSPQETGETLPVAAIQGNVSADEKWENGAAVNAYTAYRDLTVQAANEGAKLILLPESAVPVYYEQDGVLQNTFSPIASDYDCIVIMGVLRKEQDGVHNSLVAFLPDGSRSEFYDKQHPVPFGEFVPSAGILTHLFPALSSLHRTSPLTVGETDAVLRVGELSVGCFLCFDSVFAGTEQAGTDTSFLTVATNDAWFQNSSALRQHLRYAKLRAAENGKPLLRAANTGISAQISAKGRILAQTNASEKAILHGTVPLYRGNTLFGALGDWVFCAGLLLLLTLAVYRSHQRHAGQKKAETASK